MNYIIEFQSNKNGNGAMFEEAYSNPSIESRPLHQRKNVKISDLKRYTGLYLKTKHFRKRQQERHIPNDALAKILSEIKVSYADEVRLIVPRNLMKKCKITHLGTNLILVMNSHKLITIFAIPNLTDYFYNCKRDCKHYLLN